ncbi:MAG: hypothetical protein R3D55_28305 [Chloroflexota bacterium]
MTHTVELVIQRVKPREGWLPLLLLAAIVACLITAVLEVAWVSEDKVVIPAALGGLLLGSVLAKRPLSALLAWLLITLYGALISVIGLAHLWPSWAALQGGWATLRPFWLQNGALFIDRVASWGTAVFNGQSSQETVVFALGWRCSATSSPLSPAGKFFLATTDRLAGCWPLGWGWRSMATSAAGKSGGSVHLWGWTAVLICRYALHGPGRWLGRSPGGLLRRAAPRFAALCRANCPGAAGACSGAAQLSAFGNWCSVFRNSQWCSKQKRRWSAFLAAWRPVVASRAAAMAWEAAASCRAAFCSAMHRSCMKPW